MSEEEEDKAMAEWDEKLAEHYYEGSIMDGAVPICHLGCALRQWLVVTGPESGNVWMDERVDDDGIRPLTTPEGDRVDFASWYSRWK